MNIYVLNHKQSKPRIASRYLGSHRFSGHDIWLALGEEPGFHDRQGEALKMGSVQGTGRARTGSLHQGKVLRFAKVG